MIDVSLMRGPLRNHRLMSIGEESPKFNMGNQDVNIVVPAILSDMLTKSQRLKENDNHIHEDVEVDSTKVDYGVVNTHDHVDTLCEDMISKDESLLVVCAIDNVSVGKLQSRRHILFVPKEQGNNYKT